MRNGSSDSSTAKAASVSASTGIRSSDPPVTGRSKGVFHVYQHCAHRAVLEALIPFFGCGVIRAKGPNSGVLTYVVSKRVDLERVIVPFFEQHQLVVEGPDFQAFAEVVRALGRKEHLTPAGFERLVRLAYGMNAQGKQRARTLEEVLAGSSETVRQALSGN